MKNDAEQEMINFFTGTQVVIWEVIKIFEETLINSHTEIEKWNEKSREHFEKTKERFAKN